jgi:DNA-directed RNA polymerase subunit alpha
VLYYEIGRPLQRDEMKEAEETKKQQETEELRKKLNLSISELDLSIRATNCLRAEHIETVGELVVRTDEDLLKIRNFGKTSLREIQKKLSKIGLQLGMNLEAILGKK